MEVAAALTTVIRQLTPIDVEAAELLHEVIKVSKWLENLRQEFEHLQGYLDDAQKKQEEDKEVGEWMSEMKDMAYEAQEITGKHLHRIKRRRKSRSGFWKAFQLFPQSVVDAIVLQRQAKKIKSLTGKISRLTSKMKSYGVLFSPEESKTSAATPKAGGSAYVNGGEVIIGLDEDISTVVKQLVFTESTKVVGICGANGLGKTTLAKEVMKMNTIREHFRAIAWAYLGPNCQIEDVLKSIIAQLQGIIENQAEKVQGDEIEIEEDMVTLMRGILKDERCLLVLDHLSTLDDEWCHLLRDFSSVPGSSSKLLLTTCDANVLRQVDPRGFLHQLRCLNSEERWNLFQKRTASVAKGFKADFLMKNAKPVVEDCCGLPLTIHVLGGLYTHDTDFLFHRKASRSFRIRFGLGALITLALPQLFMLILLCSLLSAALSNSSQPRLFGGESMIEEEVNQVLQLSYEALPRRLRSCMVEMSDYPEGCVMTKEEVFKLWMDKGIVKKGRSQKEVGQVYLDELVKRSLIQVVSKDDGDGKTEKWQLHSLVRDFYCNKFSRRRGANASDPTPAG